jgi:hypothetical protein
MRKFWNRLLINLAKWIGEDLYIVNENTKEIHSLKHEHKNCHLNLLSNWFFVNENELSWYFKEGYNGCRFCFKKEDRG